MEVPRKKLKDNFKKYTSFRSVDFKALLIELKPYYLGALALLVLISLYHAAFARRLIPGVYVAGTRIGGLTYNQAVEKLTDQAKNTEQKLEIKHDGKEYSIKGEDFDLVYDWEATVNRAFEVGRTGNMLVDTKDKIAGLVKKLYIAAYYDFDETEFNNFLATLKGDINISAHDSVYLAEEDALTVTIESSGQKLEEEKLYDLLVKSIDSFNFGLKPITVLPSEPKITSRQLNAFKDQAEEIIFSPMVVTFEENSWPLTVEQKLEFLTFEPADNQLAFNKPAFRSFLENISQEITVLPRGRVTATQDKRVTGFELIQDGVEIDTDTSAENFKEAFFGLEGESEIAVRTISGPIDQREYGIFALLGEGFSKFSGSAAGRIHNLTLAAQRTDGVLVPPGGIYSFNESVGDISAATGYDSAWVILGSRTVLGHGGGVCQTSTTLFRAILDSGLPVLTRHPHAYRVRYYEIESAVGIDASIYQPSLDLQFKNDTTNYVMVQTTWDLDEQSLAFRIYGTPDGREVTISEPVVTNQSAPPEPLYQDDPTLAKGVVRQVDFPAWGATTSFTRQVVRDGEVLYDDVFKTNYQAWRAVYLVGTKE